MPKDEAVVDDPLGAGWMALTDGAWERARSLFEQAGAATESPEALEGLSWAAWWLDEVEDCLAARERAYGLYQEAENMCGAGRMALYLGDDHLEFHGERAVANGWFRRAASILEPLEVCPEQGWLSAFRGHWALNAQDTVEAKRLAVEARRVGRRFGVVCLEMFALAVEGLSMVNEGEVERGMSMLDEATAAALGGEYEELPPASWTCCGLISACERVRDYDRAAQWSKRIERFSERKRIRFVTGVCRAHYATVLTWHGDWAGAEQELTAAVEQLSSTRPFWRTEAIVRLADLRRRQGRFEEAEELLAAAEGNPLAPLVLADLDLDRGRYTAAVERLEQQLRQTPASSLTKRTAPLELIIRATVGAGDPASAGAHLDELRAVAAATATTPVRASLRFSEGVVAAAKGDADAAREALEDAIELFATAGGPFENGRARLELAAVLRALDRAGDAEREASTALRRFEQLGAAAEAARARALLAELRAAGGQAAERARGPLTERQLEVVRLVADGLTDRQIAVRLVLSEHTVHRHLANVYARLGCSSRAAAVAQLNRLGEL